MNKTLEGMALAFNSTPEYADVDGMRAVLLWRASLLWLADNVSDEMALAAGKCRHGSNAAFEREVIGSYRLAIAAALRAAAGGGEK